jgi:hypothetical protein
MSDLLRNKVLAFFAAYAEGGSSRVARTAARINGEEFYRALQKHPDLNEQYERIQRQRADMMVDEAYEISMDDALSPQAARERATIRINIAKLYDRKRFGDKVDINVSGAIDVNAAIDAAHARIATLPCDLTLLPDGTYGALPSVLPSSATDTSSVSAAPDGVDPFEGLG